MRYFQPPSPRGTLAYEPLVTLPQVMDHVMDQLWAEAMGHAPFRTLWAQPGPTPPQTPDLLPLDVYATAAAVVVVAAVPGLKPAEVQVTFDRGLLTLQGTIANGAARGEATGATWYRHELGSGCYRRTVQLPCEVDADKAGASVADGLVRIVLPKAAPAKPTPIAITAGAAGAASPPDERG